MDSATAIFPQAPQLPFSKIRTPFSIQEYSAHRE
jgi:hypothetical protein